MTALIPFEWFEEARKRIAGRVIETPLTHDAARGLYLKWENHQVTGSFKARGALNKVLLLEDWERERGLVAASAGNHGQGVALAGQQVEAEVDIFVPKHAVESKVESMRALGARVHFVEGGYGEAEAAARQYAANQQKTFISPYNDGQVIAGQGTAALEIVDQLESAWQSASSGPGPAPKDVEEWIVPVGGGGLISACGMVMRERSVRSRLIGVQPEASAFTHSLFYRGTQAGIEDNPTLADGLSGAIEEDSVTLPMMREFVETIVLVSEKSLGQAIAFAWEAYHERIEGSAAAALAAVLDGQVAKGPSVVLISGGNIQGEVFEALVREHAKAVWS